MEFFECFCKYIGPFVFFFWFVDLQNLVRIKQYGEESLEKISFFPFLKKLI